MNVLIITLSALLALSVPDEKTSDNIVSRIDAVTSSFRTLSCNYSYSKTVSLLQETVSAEGSVEIDMKTSVIRWTKRSPEHTEMIFSPDDVQGTSITKDNKQIYKKIAKFITSRAGSKGIGEQKDFKRTVSSANGVYVMKLTPKNRDSIPFFTQIDLTFDAKSCILKEIRITDEDSDITVISIDSVRIER